MHFSSNSSAAESGMLSSAVHETVVDVPDDSNNIVSECNMGNKFAVLVGDYFAIRTIYMAEKVKNNRTMMHVNRGVEEFTCAHFKSGLIRVDSPYPFILSPTATLEDWISFNVNGSGYFTGVYDTNFSEFGYKVYLKFILLYTRVFKSCDGPIETQFSKKFSASSKSG